MASKMESLKDKLAKIQSQIAEEEAREKQEQATAKIRDSFSEAIRETVGRVEQETGESLKNVGLGIWVAYPVGSEDASLTISALAVGLDGLPKQLKKPTTNNGNRANGANGNGDSYEYVLEDGRVFDTCEKAVNALGTETRDSEGNLLEGKKYYTRHDRLPKELQEAITKRLKATSELESSNQPEGASEGEAPEGNKPKVRSKK